MDSSDEEQQAAEAARTDASGKRPAPGGQADELREALAASPTKPPGEKVSRPQRPRRPSAKAASKAEAASAEQARLRETVLQKTAPFQGLCWWCRCRCGDGLADAPVHDPDTCPERRRPSMLDRKVPAPQQTRRARAGLQPRALAPPHEPSVGYCRPANSDTVSACAGWDDDRKLKYFPLLLVESARPRASTIKVACLRPDPQGPAGVYTIDPEFRGDTGKREKDYARMELIFDAQPITGEVWRELEGGVRGGERAWRVVRREA